MQVKLPTNEKLETLILSSAINSNYSLGDVVEQCSDEDFFNLKNRLIFSCLKSLFHNRVSITIQALMYELSKKDKKNEIENAYIMAIAYEFWSGMPYEQYIQDLKKISLLRRVISSSLDMIQEASKEDADPEKILSEHQDAMLKAQGFSRGSILSCEDISKNFSANKTFQEDMLWRCNQYRLGKKTYEGISSGFEVLDDTLGSFQNGCMYTIGARTSMGKTTFMLNFIRNMVKHSRVGVFSLEMSAPIIYAKLACIESNVRYRDFYDGKLSQSQQRHIDMMENRFSKLPLFVDDEAMLTTQKLQARAKRMKSNKKIDILFIDYLTRIKCNGKYFSKHLEIDEITKSIQALAKNLGIPIVVLAQLNRQAVTSAKSRPSMADFKESGSIEEDSDACILLHRPEYYNKSDKPGIMEVIIDKNRIMGTRTIIEFICDSSKSESYHELGLSYVPTPKETKIEHMSYVDRYGGDDDDDEDE